MKEDTKEMIAGFILRHWYTRYTCLVLAAMIAWPIGIIYLIIKHMINAQKELAIEFKDWVRDVVKLEKEARAGEFDKEKENGMV